MEKMKELFITFTWVTTFVVIATATYISVFWQDVLLSVNILWEILITSLICCLGNFLYPAHELTKNKLLFRKIIHYLYINVIVLGAGLFFEWFHADSLLMILGMLFLVAIGFVVISAGLMHRDKKAAQRLNEKLAEYKKRTGE